MLGYVDATLLRNRVDFNKIAKNQQVLVSSPALCPNFSLSSISFRANYNDEAFTCQLESEAIKEENILGSGANSTVYNIPSKPDLVLKVLNNDDPNKISMTDFPADINFGQPIWQSKTNPRLILMKKIPGSEHSIANWCDAINHPKKDISAEQAQLYFSQVDNIAQRPQEQFDKLAQKVKILSDLNYKLDSINPNNLMVADNEMNIIDFFKIPPWEIDKGVFENSYADIVSLMLDFTLLPEYFEKFSPKQKENFLKNVAIINEKAKLGAQKCGLSDDVEKYRTYINYTSQWFQIPDRDDFYRKYEIRVSDFINMLENPFEWECSTKIQ